MPTWFTSDTHFGHSNIIRLSKRPFANLDEMHAALIERWNAVVGPNDDVWHLGDFSYRSTKGLVAEIFPRLNGHKRLVIGNHDNDEVLALPWAETPVQRATIKLDGKMIVLDHYPSRSWDGLYRGWYHLYGHEHGNCDDWGNCCDVGADCWNYTPITFAQALERMAPLPKFNPQARRATQ